jgi:hypothetical protein
VLDFDLTSMARRTSTGCTRAASSMRRLPARLTCCGSWRGPKAWDPIRRSCRHARDEAFQAACELGIEGIVSKRLTAPYKSGPCRSWIKVRNPKSPAYMRIVDGTF